MAKFLLGQHDTITHHVSKATTAFLIDFELPDTERDRLPSSELVKLDGVLLMSLYSDSPMVGDLIDYRGYRWRIKERIFTATRYKSREEKSVPILKVEFVGA